MFLFLKIKAHFVVYLMFLFLAAVGYCEGGDRGHSFADVYPNPRLYSFFFLLLLLLLLLLLHFSSSFYFFYFFYFLLYAITSINSTYLYVSFGSMALEPLFFKEIHVLGIITCLLRKTSFEI